MVDPASGSRPRTRQDSLISLPFSAFLLFILVMGRPNSNTNNSSRCPNFSLTLRHPACYDLPRAVLIGRSPRQSRCLSSNPRRPRFVVGDVEASGSGVRLADVVCTVMLVVCTVMIVSVFARAWSECEQRTWGVWRRGTPTSHRRQVVSLAVR